MPNDPKYPNAKHDDSFQRGLLYQDFVVDALAASGTFIQCYAAKANQYNIGESRQGYEIKLDEEFQKYRHLSIEVTEKTKAGNRTWVPSGIFAEDNAVHYVQGNYNLIYVFLKIDLVNYHNGEKPKVEERNPTLKSFFLEIPVADKMCRKIISHPHPKNSVTL